MLRRYASDFYNKLALGHDPAALTVAVADDCPATPESSSRSGHPNGSPGNTADSVGSRALMLPLSPGQDQRCAVKSSPAAVAKLGASCRALSAMLVHPRRLPK